MYILLTMICMLALGSSFKSSVSIFDHSYFASMTDNYLSFERLSYYQQMKYFTDLCPPISAIEFLSLPKTKLVEFAYTQQEAQYLASEQFIERASSVGTLEKIFGFLFQAPQPVAAEQKHEEHTQRREASVKSSIADFYVNNYEFKEAIIINQHLKARALIAIIFLSAFVLILYRLSKRSECAKQKIPKTLSIFWFFTTIQLYLELNWLSQEPQARPYSKTLFIGLLPYDQSSNYIPETMNLLLFLVCLIYFFSLIFRFNEIFGSDDLQDVQYMEHINQLATSVQKDKKAKQGQGSHIDKVEEIIEESDDDFSMTGLATQPIIQVPPIGVKTALELYHFVIIHVTLFLTFLKLIMLCEGFLFVKVSESSRICILDNLEIFPFTPRYLAMFTVSFLAFSEYIGKSQTDRTQYNFQKIGPFLITVLHSLILVLRRRYLLTIDDLIIGIVFATSFSLYLSLEYKRPFEHAKDTLKKGIDARQLKKNPMADGKGKIEKRKSGTKEEFELRSRTLSYDQKDLARDNDIRSRQQHLSSFDKIDDYTYSDIEDDSSTESQLPSDDADRFKLKKIPIKNLQDMLFSQLRDLTEEETNQIFQYGGDFDVHNEMHLIQRMNMIEQIKRNQAIQQQQALQGGQGQQSNQNLKQTAHKIPTKAPSGRPNPRKRR